MSSPAAKRLRTNTIGDAQATQAEIPSATSQATATSSQATAEKAKDLFEQLEKKEIRRLLIDAAKAHPDVLLGMEDSIKAAIEREKARVINFDHHSKNVWWSINCEHSSKRGSAQYEMAYDVAQGVEDTIVSIVIECGPNSSFGTRVNGLSVLRKIGKTIALSEGDTIAHEVKNSFQSNTVLTRGMMKILNTMERSELDSILKSDLYEKLVDLDELSDGYCLFEGLAEVLSKTLGEDGKKAGSAITRALVKKYPAWDLTVIDQNPPSAKHELPGGVSYRQVDITSIEAVKSAFAAVNPHVVVHTAGIIPGLAERFRRRMQSKVWQVNVEGTRNMLHESKQTGVEVFVYTSSCCVVTDDTLSPYPNVDEEWPSSLKSTIYGESKAAAEALVLKASNSEMATCALRPSVLCGPGDCQLLPPIHACIANHETAFLIGDGLNLWDITHVDNVADAHVLAIENLLSTRTAAGEAFFIQNNEPITFRDLCLAIWAHFGHIPPFQVRIPQTMAYLVGLACETVTWAMGSTATLSRGSVRDACAVRYASGEKAKEILGYEARIGIEEAIRLSCEDYASRLLLAQDQTPDVTRDAGPLSTLPGDSDKVHMGN